MFFKSLSASGVTRTLDAIQRVDDAIDRIFLDEHATPRLFGTFREMGTKQFEARQICRFTRCRRNFAHDKRRML